MERKYGRMTLLSVLALLAFPVLAQQETGNIAGTVTTEDGEALPGVTINAEGKYLFGARTTITDENGRYRLRNLPVGSYEVTFVMPGFKTVKLTGVPVALGQTTTKNVQMTVSQVEEVLTVTSNQPLVDATTSNMGDTFDNEILEALPTSKDPWSILEITPGVSMSQNNVGGNKQGTQARFGANGTSPYQNAYYVDGINLTDTSASGASGQYYDYDTFEAIQVSTASHDASVGAPGVNITMVTKTGSNEWDFKAAYGISDQAWQSSNAIPRGEGVAPLESPQDYNREYNLSVGGPIIKDKLWFFVAYHENEVNLYTPNTDKTITDLTELEQINANIKWSINNQHTLKLSYNENDKIKSNRLPTFPSSSYYQGAGLGWAQSGPGDAWYIQDEWFVNDRLTLSFKYGQQAFPFQLGIPAGVDESILDGPPVIISDVTQSASSAYVYPIYDRSNDTYTVKGNWFQTIGATSHDVSFGLDILLSENYAENRYPGDAIVRQYDESGGEVWFIRPVRATNETENTALYVNDVITAGKWTFNVGLRYQEQTGTINAGALDATWQNGGNAGTIANGTTIADRFGSVTSPELADVAEWTDILPRINVTYDLNADGRTLFKLGLNQYAHVMNNSEFELASALSEYEEDWAWEDNNGDGTFLGDGSDWDEIVGDRWVWSSGIASGTPIDPDYEAPLTDELLLNFSHQFENNLALTATYIYRNTSNLTYTFEGYHDAGGNFVNIGDRRHWSEATYTDSEGNERAGYVFDPSDADQALIDQNYTTVRGNLDDYEVEYSGIELTLAHRGNGYAWNASLTQGGTDLSYNPFELNDPNTGEDPDGGSSAAERDFSNDYASEWSAHIYGAVTLPWDLQLSSKIRYSSGSFYSVFTRYSSGWSNFNLLDNREEDSLPSYALFDVGLGKTFSVGNAGNLEVKMDIFNLFNDSTAVSYASTRTGVSSFLSTSEILGPRILRFNVSYIY